MRTLSFRISKLFMSASLVPLITFQPSFVALSQENNESATVPATPPSTTSTANSAPVADQKGSNLPSTVSIGGAPSAPVDTVDEFAREKQELKTQILSLVPESRHFRELLANSLVDSYAGRGFRSLWDPATLPAGIHRSLCAGLADHAFPDLFALDPDELSQSISTGLLDKKDLAYSIAILDAGLLVRMGAVPGESIWDKWYTDDTPGSEDWTVEAIRKDLLAATALRPFEIPRILETLGPKNWIYRELSRAFPEAKKSILTYSGLPQIPNPSSAGVAKPGEPCSYAPAIAAHLIDRGYLKMDGALIQTLASITPELSNALIAFQKDYGLDPDGVFGPASWRYLNTNAADQYRSIAINMHRARLIPNDLGERYALVNLPSAELYLFEDNDFFADSMRIVHGRSSKDTHHTPVFRDVMQEVVFGPYWNVPKSIAVKEVLPKAENDWGFLSRNRYEIVSNFNPYNKSAHRLSPANLEMVRQGRLFLRQKPGPSNALGRVKFLFPNKFNIYMHDTPAKNYFLRSERDHSHGCIRLGDPQKMGAWVLQPEEWTSEKVKSAMFADERKSMTVKGGINVYIVYFTTFPRPIPGGKIVLAPARDVYERDDPDSAILRAAIPWTQQPDSTNPAATTAPALRATVIPQ